MTETPVDYEAIMRDSCRTCGHDKGSHRPLGCVDCAEAELSDSDGTRSVDAEHDFVLAIVEVERVQWWSGPAYSLRATQSAVHYRPTRPRTRTLCDLIVPAESRRVVGVDRERKPCRRCAKRAREMGATVVAA